jgi:hypothetical protein
MISKEEYFAALELIDKYHRQFEKVYFTSNSKTLVDDWINKHNKRISGRLIKCLKVMDNKTGGIRVFNYIEDITEREFLKQRRNGCTSWNEFQRVLREIDEFK